MGLLKSFVGAAGGTMADQWLEYFYCNALPADVLITKGEKRVGGRSSNTKASDNIISNGSIIAVNDGQCMIIVEQGKVVDLCAEPGEYKYDSSSEPSIFYGGLGTGILDAFRSIGKRFTFGGEPPKDQRVYYFNTKELIGNKYGTPSPVPFRVVDTNVGLDIDIAIRCFGEYSYKIVNPILFYTNVCGNVEWDYKRDGIDSQLRSELMTALQPAFAKISSQGIRYSALPGHTDELADALNSVLSPKWSELRGIIIVSLGVSSVKASEEDEKMIKELQRNAAFRNPNMAAAHLVGAQAEAMQAAARNEGGAAMAFMGMNMAQNAGGANANNLFQMGSQQMPPPPPSYGMPVYPATQAAPPVYTAPVSQVAPTTPSSYGAPISPAPPTVNPVSEVPAANSWICACGNNNSGKFCAECGSPKPSAALQCTNCGWIPVNATPKFCPECGTPFILLHH